MAETGRNQLCPCGSGRKYKHCCANKAARIDPANLAALTNPALMEAYQHFIESHDSSDAGNLPSFMEWQGTPNRATDFNRQLSAALRGHEFASEAEVQRAVDQFTHSHNQKPNWTSWV